MVTLPPESPPDLAQPRNRRLLAALCVGLLTFGLTFSSSVVGAAIVWQMTKNGPLTLELVGRFTWFAVAAGVAAAVLRGISAKPTDRLLAMRSEGGLSGAIGFLLGMILTGYVAEKMVPDAIVDPTQPAIGQAMEIAGPTLAGGRFDLAEHRGQVVLVDFWASWCGPCIGELPNVRGTYDKYHGDGFEVVGVSLDFERSALAEFVRASPEPWPQVFFDQEGQRGFDNPLAKRYGIQAIPCLMVIDPQGKLRAYNVRGPQIEASVAEALGRPLSWTNRLAAVGRRLHGWFVQSVLYSPPWLLILCSVGATAVCGGGGKAARRALRRTAS